MEEWKSNNTQLRRIICWSMLQYPIEDDVDYFQLDNYFGNNSSYKMWGDNSTNSEHIAHNILSQLFEEERSKSPLPNTMWVVLPFLFVHPQVLIKYQKH